jgi:Sulfotransferase family
VSVSRHDVAWPSEEEELRQLCRARIDHVVPVREPLVLVSQIQRSGGTLLSQLFDGHPECHAHPSEVYIGHPRKWDWPQLDLGRPDSWFDLLYEQPVELHLREGYVKHKESRAFGHEVYPFLFLPALQRAIFEAGATAAPVSERDVLDWYFTSYFNAWLDNQNLYAAPKKAVTGFTPRLATSPENVARFFDCYPDGRLVSIVRDPAGWYASASGYRAEYADLEEALAQWSESTSAAIAAAERFGDAVILVTYEDLVLETEATMAALAARTGISMHPSLLEPTFNGRPVRANSSLGAAEHGVIAGRANAHRQTLDDATQARIEELAGDLHGQAVALASR